MKLKLIQYKPNNKDIDCSLELSFDKGLTVLEEKDEYRYSLLSFASVDIEHDYLSLDDIELYPKRDYGKEFDVLDVVSKDFAFSVVFIFDDNKKANQDFMTMLRDKISEFKNDVPKSETQAKKKLSSVVDLLSVCHPSYFFYSLEDGHNIYPEMMKEVFSKSSFPCVVLNKPRKELPKEETKRLIKQVEQIEKASKESEVETKEEIKNNVDSKEPEVVVQEEKPVVKKEKPAKPVKEKKPLFNREKIKTSFTNIKNSFVTLFDFVKHYWDSFLFFFLQCILFSSLLLLGFHLVGKNDVNIVAPIIFIAIGIVCYILSIVIEADLFAILKKENNPKVVLPSLLFIGVISIISFGIGFGIFYALAANNLLVKMAMFNSLLILVPGILTLILLAMLPFNKQIEIVFEKVAEWFKNRFSKKK